MFKTCDSLLSPQASSGPDFAPPPAQGWGFICNKFFWHLKPAFLCHLQSEHYFCRESSSHIHAEADHSLGPWILKVHVSPDHYVLPAWLDVLLVPTAGSLSLISAHPRRLVQLQFNLPDQVSMNFSMTSSEVRYNNSPQAFCHSPTVIKWDFPYSFVF